MLNSHPFVQDFGNFELSPMNVASVNQPDTDNKGAYQTAGNKNTFFSPHGPYELLHVISNIVAFR